MKELYQRLFYEGVEAEIGQASELLYVSVENQALSHLPYIIALDHTSRSMLLPNPKSLNPKVSRQRSARPQNCCTSAWKTRRSAISPTSLPSTTPAGKPYPKSLNHAPSIHDCPCAAVQPVHPGHEQAHYLSTCNQHSISKTAVLHPIWCRELVAVALQNADFPYHKEQASQGQSSWRYLE